MKLRIHRTSEWVLRHGTFVGDPQPQYDLIEKDELQVELPDGTWQAIPVVEELSPEHPVIIERRNRLTHAAEGMSGLNTIIQDILLQQKSNNPH